MDDVILIMLAVAVGYVVSIGFVLITMWLCGWGDMNND